MHKIPLCVVLLLWMFMPEVALAETPEVVDETGKIESGKYWGHISAAYIVTWLGLIGYTVSLWARRPKGAGQ